MRTLAAENHYNWQVEIGSHRRDPSGQRRYWDRSGYGCLVHAQIVLTSSKVWEQAEESVYRTSERMIRIGETDYPCNLGYEDKERGLTALVLASAAKDRNGEAFSCFPPVADQPPQAGQALGLLKTEHLHSENHPGAHDHYLCFTFGCVSLLRGKKELLFGLSGVVWQADRFGSAIFDDCGTVYGVSTDYLRTEHEKRFSKTLSGYLVFAPIYSMAAIAKQLALSNPTKSP